ncbi:MAG: 1,4-dihydroxy-6-naphtoate synthase [Bacteroidia bacterium]|nr:MAG: 1,4-dihydroxy-6-naphtoate synthase [Bacteroidia bacterium]
MKKIIHLGFSPCPNDCFIFDALIHKKIDTGQYEFIPVIEDVENLNQLALKGELEVTKLSYHAYMYCTDKYVYLNSGSALGFGCGPLLITHSESIAQNFINPSYRSTLRVLIPGELTTAHLLLKKFFPEIKSKTCVLFSEIEDLLLKKQYDAGLIIHENRFTYSQKGLIKIVDFGEIWEQQTHLPIPLGGIMAKKSLGESTILEIDRLIKESVIYAFKHPKDVMNFVKQHAQEMDESVMRQHIQLYVNDFSIDLGVEGRKAIEYFIGNIKNDNNL